MQIRHFMVAACFALALLITFNSQSSATPLAPMGGEGLDIAETDASSVQPVDFYFYFGPGYNYPRWGFGYRPRYYYYTPRRSHRSYRYSNRRQGRSCGYWSDRCIENWGYNNSNYRGCLRYYGCY